MDLEFSNLPIPNPFLVPTYSIEETTIWDEFEIQVIDKYSNNLLCDVEGDFDIAFTPNSPVTSQLISLLANDMYNSFRCPDVVEFKYKIKIMSIFDQNS